MIIESILLGVSSTLTAAYRNNDSYLYANENCPIYTSMPSSTGKDFYAANIMLSDSQEAPISEDVKFLTDNYNKLLQSFKKNVGKNDVVFNRFKNIANLLCSIPSKEVLVQYSDYDDSLDFQMVLMDGLELSISQFLNESDDLVDFTISNNNKLLVCGEMPISDFVGKIIDLSKS